MLYESEAPDDVKVRILDDNKENNEEAVDIHHIHIPLYMEFKNLVVKAGEKIILNDVSGKFLPGELVAIMGPSGAGKSTLLNFLAGRAKGMELAGGEIKINGQKVTKAIRRRIGYVLQEDVFFSHLTVNQTLQFVGEVRLPETLTKPQKYKIVDEVIQELGLSKCVNTVMGGGLFLTGCSGGEKKRCSIATELITNPSMLMMDEPTSGLDSSTAFNLINTLKNLAQTENRTIVTTIHQPSSHVFHMFDKLLLIADGKVAYFGRTSNVLKFFEFLGTPCYQNWNPADFIMEQLTIESELKKTIADKFIEFKSQTIEENGHVDNVDISNEKQANGNGVKENGDTNGAVEIEDSKVPRWPTGYRTQVLALCGRAFIQSRKNMLDKLAFIQTIGISLICGILWLNTPYDEDSLSDRLGVIFFVVVYLTMNPMFFALMTFPAERNAIAKERAAGMYRLSAYYTAKSVSELPILLIQPLLLYTITYWMSGLNRSPVFLIGMLVIATTSILAQSIGLVLGGAIKDFKRSITCTIIIALTSMLLGGFYTKRIPHWLSWTKYVSHISYAYNIMVRLEFQYATEVFSCAEKSAYTVCERNNTIIGDHILPVVTFIGLSVGQSFAVLWGFIVVFQVLFYMVLKYFNKPT